MFVFGLDGASFSFLPHAELVDALLLPRLDVIVVGVFVVVVPLARFRAALDGVQVRERRLLARVVVVLGLF